MTQTTTKPARYFEWLGSIEKEFDPRDKTKITSAKFYKKQIRTGEARGVVITGDEVKTLNSGLLERPGMWHGLWLPDTEKNRKHDPIDLDINQF